MDDLKNWCGRSEQGLPHLTDVKETNPYSN